MSFIDDLSDQQKDYSNGFRLARNTRLKKFDIFELLRLYDDPTVNFKEDVIHKEYPFKSNAFREGVADGLRGKLKWARGERSDEERKLNWERGYEPSEEDLSSDASERKKKPVKSPKRKPDKKCKCK